MEIQNEISLFSYHVNCFWFVQCLCTIANINAEKVILSPSGRNLSRGCVYQSRRKSLQALLWWVELQKAFRPLFSLHIINCFQFSTLLEKFPFSPLKALPIISLSCSKPFLEKCLNASKITHIKIWAHSPLS